MRLHDMIHSFTRVLRASLGWWALPAVLLAAGPPLSNTESSEGELDFNFIPRAFQKDPFVDQTVITELTEAGKKIPPPSPSQPIYYLAESGGYRTEGHGAPNENPPPAAEITAALQHALAVNGYLPATPMHPPQLLVVYFWGEHTNFDPGSGEFDHTAFPDAGHKNLLARAALVGGTKFAEELRQVLQKQDREDEMRTRMPPAVGGMLTSFGPLRMFVQRDYKSRQLYEESRADCYFVVASAYHYASAIQGKRTLLWRTKMTLDSRGVAMRDTLPRLILNAGKYLGVDMPEAATITRRMKRGEHVTLGPLEVKEYRDPAADRPLPSPTNTPEDREGRDR